MDTRKSPNRRRKWLAWPVFAISCFSAGLATWIEKVPIDEARAAQFKRRVALEGFKLDYLRIDRMCQTGRMET